MTSSYLLLRGQPPPRSQTVRRSQSLWQSRLLSVDRCLHRLAPSERFPPPPSVHHCFICRECIAHMENGTEQRRVCVLGEFFREGKQKWNLCERAADRSSNLGHSKLMQGHWDIQNSKCSFGSRNSHLNKQALFVSTITCQRNMNGLNFSTSFSVHGTSAS